MRGDRPGYVNRGDLQEVETSIIDRLTRGEVEIPQVVATQVNIAGGNNHAPNSDFSYSTLAATVAGTLPAAVADLNYEAWRVYRQLAGSSIVVNAAHALKSSDHSLYVGDERVNPEVPIWNRVSGWCEMGSEVGTDQYDIVLQLLNKPVAPGQRWFFLCRLVALDPMPVPADVQLAIGVWQKGATEGFAAGEAFDLQYEVVGLKGATSTEYRVLAKTDSGVSVLSNVLTIPNSPDVLSSDDYNKIFYFAGPGFIEFEIYRKRAGVYAHLFTVRNTTDFQYNDTGPVRIGVKDGWPAAPVAGASPQAYAETRTLRVGSYNGAWALNQLSLRVPSTYDSSATDSDGQFLRVRLTAPTGVNRHIGIDLVWWSTTLNEWSPDPPIKFADGTFAIPTVSPSSGNQGSGGGVYDPPGEGGGGGVPCVLSDMPVLTRGRNWFRRFRFKIAGYLTDERLEGEWPEPYLMMSHRVVARSEFYQLRTANGITYDCTPDHRLCLDVYLKAYVRAEDVEVGKTKLLSWERRWWFWSRQVQTLVVAKVFVPESCQVVDISLRHPMGATRAGEGHYIAGWSDRMDRGLFSSNVKLPFNEL